MTIRETLMLFAILYPLFLAMQIYTYRALRRRSAELFQSRTAFFARWGARLYLLATNISIGAFILYRIKRDYPSEFWSYVLMYPIGFYILTIAGMFLILGCTDLVILFRTLIATGKPGFSLSVEHNPQRRRLLRNMSILATGAILGTPPILSVATRKNIQIKRIPLMLNKLPSSFDGLTIAQLSDLHSGMFMSQSDMENIADRVNSLTTDIIVVTGDFVEHANFQIEPMYQAMKRLKAPMGVYGCLGNHDHYASAERINAALVKAGFIMLNNANVVFRRGSEPLALLGVDDYRYDRRSFARLDLAMNGVDPRWCRILLSHEPLFFPFAKEAGIDLMLAGHTHGGQIGFEIGDVNFNPFYYNHKHLDGLYDEDGSKLYVNTGVGMVVFPYRFVPPELTVFELHSV
jgi:hypothetical protein